MYGFGIFLQALLVKRAVLGDSGKGKMLLFVRNIVPIIHQRLKLWDDRSFIFYMILSSQEIVKYFTIPRLFSTHSSLKEVLKFVTSICALKTFLMQDFRVMCILLKSLPNEFSRLASSTK